MTFAIVAVATGGPSCAPFCTTLVRDPVDDVHAVAGHGAEDRVHGRQGGGAVDDEELRAVGARAGVGQRHGADRVGRVRGPRWRSCSRDRRCPFRSDRRTAGR